MTIVGIVAAAGAGRRFGMPKVLAYQGEWLRRAVSALDVGGCDEVVVALGAAIVAVPAPARPLIVDNWADGLGATLRAALTAVRGPDVDGVVIHLVDVPDVDHRSVAAVLHAVQRGRHALARASFDGRPGHPVYLGVDDLDAVAATLTGDAGAGHYLRDRDDVLLVECGQWSTGSDQDTPAGQI